MEPNWLYLARDYLFGNGWWFLPLFMLLAAYPARLYLNEGLTKALILTSWAFVLLLCVNGIIDCFSTASSEAPYWIEFNFLDYYSMELLPAMTKHFGLSLPFVLSRKFSLPLHDCKLLIIAIAVAIIDISVLSTFTFIIV